MATSYYELLRHPEWQKKRLRVMEAAGFACQECSATDKTLNVHHRHYRKGAKPWEHEDHELQCLCEDCHTQRHEVLERLKVTVGQLSSWWLDILVGCAKGLLLLEQSPDDTKVPVVAEAEAYGLTYIYGLPWDGGVGPLAVLDERDQNGMIDDQTLTALSKELRAAERPNG